MKLKKVYLLCSIAIVGLILVGFVFNFPIKFFLIYGILLIFCQLKVIQFCLLEKKERVKL
jgi:hypothetical protein